MAISILVIIVIRLLLLLYLLLLLLAVEVVGILAFFLDNYSDNNSKYDDHRMFL